MKLGKEELNRLRFTRSAIISKPEPHRIYRSALTVAVFALVIFLFILRD